MSRRWFLAVALHGLLLTASTASAQQPDLTEASRQSENPVARWITLPLRYQADFLEGPYKDTKDTFQISQAIVPFRLNEDWWLITRTKLPFISQPPTKRGGSWAGGLSNGYTTFFLSPDRGDGFFWGVGPLIAYPSSNDPGLGPNKWGSGASVAFVVQPAGPWQFGAVSNNIWSFGGASPGGARTNQFLLNPFINYNLADGWAIGSSPQIIGNWIANGGKWTVPVGGGFSKVIDFGALPVKFAVDSYYNAIRPKAANDTWLLQFTVTLLLPN